MTAKRRSLLLLAGALGGVFAASHGAAQTTVDTLVEAEEQRIQEAQADQDEIDGIVATTRSRFDEYQALLKEIEGLESYTDLLQAQIDDQNQTLATLRRSIDNVTVIERQILPLMTRMIAGLERFIELDLPFRLEERLENVEFLKDLVRSSDFTIAEQFRNVIEGWQIEVNDYGQNSEIYTDIIQIDGRPREVEILRIGRVVLAYLTPDGSDAGIYDPRAREWVPLDDEMNAEIRAGIESVRTGNPVQFVVPVAPPEES
jgi:hypothetical protein